MIFSTPPVREMRKSDEIREANGAKAGNYTQRAAKKQGNLELV